MTIRIIAGGIIGALIGSAAGYFMKCAGGSCPLTCNPWTGAVTGAIVGGLLSAGY